jgi:hypothetical protein
LGDWLSSKPRLLTSKASPNDTGIVIVVIIIVIGEAIMGEHRDADYSTDSNAVRGEFDRRRYTAARSIVSRWTLRAIQ